MADWIFLDHHSKPRPSKKQIDQWSLEASNQWWSGPTSKAVEKIGDLIGATDHHLTLTAGVAEAHYQVLENHYIDSIRQTGRSHIISLDSEQTTILRAIKRLEKFEVQGKLLSLERLTASDLQGALRARSSLLSLSWAHPLTGIIQPIHDLIAVCKEHDIKIHLDVGAALGKLYFQLGGLDVDYLTIDASLLHLPVQMGAVFSKEKIFGMRPFPHPYYSALCRGIEESFDQIDHYAMDVSWQRDLFEEELEKGGAQVHYQDMERLPNTTVVSFEGIHNQKLSSSLKKEGVFATALSTNPNTISFVLSSDTSAKEMERAARTICDVAGKLNAHAFVAFSEEDAKAKNMRVCTEKVESQEEGRSITLSLLVDEEDGVIVDCRFMAFGPETLDDAADALCLLLLRKNYMQARRITADLIQQKAKNPPKNADLNLLIDAIDAATEPCFDIPIEDIYVAPPEMEGGDRVVYPNWEQLSNEQKKSVIDEVMERDVVPYVELDAGGVEVLKVEDNRVTIAYSGNCTSCFSATGATLDAIGNILRHKIFPDLMVIPDMSVLQK